MAAEIGALRALLTATSAVFEKDMKDAKNSVRRHGGDMQKSLKAIGERMGAATIALAKYAAAAGAAAAVGFAYFIKKQIDAADAIGKMAAQTGTTTEFLSAMGFVAEQTGTSLETIARSTQRLTRYMSDAARGTGEARHAFELLNLDIQESGGNLRDVEDVLLDIAEKFSGLEDGAEKTALAMQMFGRSGAELIPMLNKGRDGIAELTQRAQEMGLVIGQETADQAALLNDQINELKNQAVGFGREVMVSVLPSLNEAVKVIREAHIESGILTAAWVGLAFAWSKAFGGTEREIKKIDKELERLERRMERVSGGRPTGFTFSQGHLERKQAKEIEELTDQYQQLSVQRSLLQVQLSVEQEEEKRRIQESIERIKKEAEERMAATDALRKDAEERARIRALEAEEKAAAEARIREAQAVTDAIENQIAMLELQRDTLGMTAEEATLYRISLMDGLTPAQKQLAEETMNAIVTLQRQIDIMAEGEQVYRSVMTSAERYAETVERLTFLFGKGAISAETYYRALAQAREPVEKLADTIDPLFEDLQRTIEGWGRSSARAIADFATDGKKSFSDMVRSMISEMIELLVYRQLMEPLFGRASAGIGSLSLPSSPTAVPIPAGLEYAKGGYIGETVLGIGRNSGKSYEFHGNEFVVPAGQLGGDVIVNVINNNGSKVSTQERQGPQGMEIDVVIDQIMAAKMHQRGSQANKTMRMYGLNEGLIGR